MARPPEPRRVQPSREELIRRQTPVVQRRGEHGWFERARREIDLGESPARSPRPDKGAARREPARRNPMPWGGGASSGPSAGGSVRRAGGAGFRAFFFVAMLGGLAFAAFQYREEIVRQFPGAYPVYRALGIDVTEPFAYGLAIPADRLRYFRIRADDGAPALLVRGVVENRTAERRALPRVRFVATAPGMAPVEWTHVFAESEIGPGRQIEFSATQKTPRPMVNVKIEWRFVPR